MLIIIRRIIFALQIWRKWRRQDPSDPLFSPWADIDWPMAWEVACILIG